MTDFGGLALNIQHVQLQEVPVSRVAKTPKKNETYRNENFKVNPKLLQILKDNQQELSAEEQQQQQLAQMQNNNNGNGNEQQMEEEKNYRRIAAATTTTKASIMSSPDQLKKTSSADYGGHKFEKDVLALRKKPQASRKFINPKILDINMLPEKILLHVFSFLNHHEVKRCAFVCKMWRNLCMNPKLWRSLRLRPDYKDSLYIRNVDYFTYLIAHRFSMSLEFIELSIDLITANLLHELAGKCPNLKHVTLDFSAAMQLQDFNDLNAFPCNLKSLAICLSEVIFLEGFMRRIYSSLASLECLHLIGTLETSNEPDESYETINISKIRAYTPNLRVVNFYGITFIDDTHIEQIANGCIHLECLALNFCSRYKGHSLKLLLGRCKKLRSLLLQNTAIESNAIKQVEWEQTNLEEIDLSSTDLNEQAMLKMLFASPNMTYLSVAYCDGFTDNVFQTLIKNRKLTSLIALDLSHTVNLNYEEVFSFLKLYGAQLRGFMYTGNVKITEQFWISSIKNMTNIKIAVMGTPLGWFKQIATCIHIDQIIEQFAINCPDLERLEIQWDPETIRFNENSRKFIDHIRLKCSKLKSLVLSDGEYYEMVKSNFERAERAKIVRTTTTYRTSIVRLLKYHNQLLFN